ncbi:MAG: chemotaxis protein CheX [Desulfuromonadales bacterium]
MINPEILVQLNRTEEQLIKLLDADVREIFATMVGINISLCQTTNVHTKFTDSVSALVGFAGCYNGMIGLNTSKKLAISFTSQMLGMEAAECDEADVTDAVGEIVNMMGGSFKHHFVNNGHEVRLSTPSVISGDEYVLSVGVAPDTLTIMFEYDTEKFMVSLYLETGD